MHLYDPDSILLSSTNVPLTNFCYHTSLGDLTSQEILSLLKNFDCVNFVDYMFDLASDLYNETNILLTYISHFKKVTNFQVKNTLKYYDQDIVSRPAEPILWAFGCSHTYGSGLESKQKRYADLIGEQLMLKSKIVAKPGSSTEWSLRHIINTNFLPDDIVIWQLTVPDRVSTCNGEILLTDNSIKKLPYLLEIYSDKELFFNQINFLNYGVNYLRAKKIKFVITSLEVKNSLFYDYLKEYVKYKEYCYSPNFGVDRGNDKIHFGPKSHANLSKSLINHIKFLYG